MKREKGKENEKKETTKQNKNSDLVVRIWKVMNERMKKEACFHSVPSLHYLLSFIRHSFLPHNLGKGGIECGPFFFFFFLIELIHAFLSTSLVINSIKRKKKKRNTLYSSYFTTNNK